MKKKNVCINISRPDNLFYDVMSYTVKYLSKIVELLTIKTSKMTIINQNCQNEKMNIDDNIFIWFINKYIYTKNIFYNINGIHTYFQTIDIRRCIIMTATTEFN